MSRCMEIFHLLSPFMEAVCTVVYGDFLPVMSVCGGCMCRGEFAVTDRCHTGSVL